MRDSYSFKEAQRDLFAVSQGYYLGHCISSDFALGAGIAKQFDEIFDMRDKLRQERELFKTIGAGSIGGVGSVVVIDNVFNLITKEKYWHKPTYETLTAALIDMREYMEEHLITKLAIPKIGCGLDRLEWDVVLEILCDIFDDSDVEILVCTL